MRHGRTRRVRKRQTGAETQDAETEVMLNPESIANIAIEATISGIVTGLIVKRITGSINNKDVS